MVSDALKLDAYRLQGGADMAREQHGLIVVHAEPPSVVSRLPTVGRAGGAVTALPAREGA